MARDQPVKGRELVLALETSCDETAAAVVRGDGEVLANVVASQIALHRPHGGVVPELASREHNLTLLPVVGEALRKAEVDLRDLDLIAATAGPGLASSLLVGNTSGKTLALALGLPFFAVNHLEGHLLSPFLGRAGGVQGCVALIVSGGHTLLLELRGVGDYRLLGATRDDAAGEAFDKGAKLLGLPYPGGPEMDQRARSGNAAAFDFPRSMLDSGDHEFSFSGLKTSLRYLLAKMDPAAMAERLDDLCASYQAAIVEILTRKALAAVRATGRRALAVSGGVSRNSALRDSLARACGGEGVELLLAPADLATDNAAMIGYAALLKHRAGQAPSALSEDIDPNLALPVNAGWP
jgi:N6-L-threonylcarbamoyladenine synthase